MVLNANKFHVHPSSHTNSNLSTLIEAVHYLIISSWLF